jgi:hypothetical protein
MKLRVNACNRVQCTYIYQSFPFSNREVIDKNSQKIYCRGVFRILYIVPIQSTHLDPGISTLSAILVPIFRLIKPYIWRLNFLVCMKGGQECEILPSLRKYSTHKTALTEHCNRWTKITSHIATICNVRVRTLLFALKFVNFFLNKLLNYKFFTKMLENYFKSISSSFFHLHCLIIKVTHQSISVYNIGRKTLGNIKRNSTAIQWFRLKDM